MLLRRGSLWLIILVETQSSLYIWWVGVGEAHLMHAVGHDLVKKGVGKVVCVTSEQFTNDLVASFRSKMTDAFKKKYRQVGALLIDDVQFFGGKEQTQEEFFHTFNELTNKQAQIIMTSDRKPQEITGTRRQTKKPIFGRNDGGHWFARL